MKHQDAIFLPQDDAQGYLLIWMHGLGDCASSFIPWASNCQKVVEGLSVLLPNAPSQPITINHGMMMPAWYDILSFDKRAQADKWGMQKSVESLVECIDHYRGSRPNDQLIIGGFSQGAVMALLLAQAYEFTMAGLCLASGYLPYQPFKIKDHQLPVLITHGRNDQIIGIEHAQQMSTILKAQLLVQWVEDDAGHEMSVSHQSALLSFLISICDAAS